MASKKAAPTESGALVFLLPEEITLDEDTNVRPFSTDPTELETSALQTLADTIEEEGQTQAIEVRRVNGDYHLVDGRRRRDAVQLINMGKAKGEEPLKVKAIVESEMGPAVAFRHAMLANIHRENFTAMDFAADIKSIRQRFPDAKGKKGTKWIADFLKVSQAKVTTHEKLLKLPKDIQSQIHEGILAASAGFELANVKPEERAQVLAEAGMRQSTEETKETKGAKKAGAAAKGGTKAKHVRAAARESGAAKKVKARSRSEIVEYFSMRDGPDWGQDGSATREFLRVFVEEFATGKCSERKFDVVFDKMIELAMKAEKAKPKSRKAA